MITFTSIGEYGRLGNQLFQYAILFVVSKETGFEIKIPSISHRYWHGQRCLLGSFNISAKEFTTDTIKYQYSEKKIDEFHYNPEIFNIQDNTDIFGFFQNYRYYEKHEDLIIKELTPKEEIIERNKIVFGKIKEEYSDYQIVSLHIRRGDSNHNMFINGKWFKYFSDAKKMFENKKCKFLVFTGGNRIDDKPDSDYAWCKDNLIGDEFIYANCENSTINDFTLMYLCDAHILSPTSTLSWWVGFLNKHKKKTIIAPELYFQLDMKLDDNFYPNNFILL